MRIASSTAAATSLPSSSQEKWETGRNKESEHEGDKHAEPGDAHGPLPGAAGVVLEIKNEGGADDQQQAQCEEPRGREGKRR